MIDPASLRRCASHVLPLSGNREYYLLPCQYSLGTLYHCHLPHCQPNYQPVLLFTSCLFVSQETLPTSTHFQLLVAQTCGTSWATLARLGKTPSSQLAMRSSGCGSRCRWLRRGRTFCRRRSRRIWRKQRQMLCRIRRVSAGFERASRYIDWRPCFFPSFSWFTVCCLFLLSGYFLSMTCYCVFTSNYHSSRIYHNSPPLFEHCTISGNRCTQAEEDRRTRTG